jgi:para-nitrobenzyl esterase
MVKLVVMMMMMEAAAAAAAAAAVDTAPRNLRGGTELASVLVQTALGPVRGKRFGPVESFHELPFAAPPVGPLRFAPAHPAKAWAPKVLDATGSRDPTSCWQSGGSGAFNGGTGDGVVNWRGGSKVLYSEDCLTLDLYRPAAGAPDTASRAPPPPPLPILLFVHGGGFTQGSASGNDGTSLAASQNIIVVFVNYRLGPLGNSSRLIMMPPWVRQL